MDSEHFSIWSEIKDMNSSKIQEVIITASGGPFFNLKNKKIKKTPKLATNHPNWKMGKKISTDSANLMNKVFEVIEAKKIFDIDLKKFNIWIHPKSYVHAIIKFKNGLIKLIAHETDMRIPIFNSIYNSNIKTFNSKKININFLNNLNFSKADPKQYPLVNILKKIPKNEIIKYFLNTSSKKLIILEKFKN